MCLFLYSAVLLSLLLVFAEFLFIWISVFWIYLYLDFPAAFLLFRVIYPLLKSFFVFTIHSFYISIHSTNNDSGSPKKKQLRESITDIKFKGVLCICIHERKKHFQQHNAAQYTIMNHVLSPNSTKTAWPVILHFKLGRCRYTCKTLQQVYNINQH